jgi:crossover junction endodeoxyribonuclease RuvC
MLALGIDPGTATVGYGVVRQLHDGAFQAVAYDVITTPAGMPMSARLRIIYDQLTALIELHKPDTAAVEQLYFGKNITTAITVAQGRGVILLALSLQNIPIAEYQPSIIKQTVTGYGSAKKPQVQEMVRILLGLESVPKPDDAADALAIAITALQHAGYEASHEYNP